MVVTLHPGTVATPLTAKYAGSHPTVTPDQAAANLLSVLGGLAPEDSGGFFDWQGRRYTSLSAIPRAITGTRWNGPLFFGLRGGKP